MILRNNCSAWLGLAGACLFVIGCGGGDVPDPGSDAKAADGSVPGGGGGGRQQAAGPAPVVAAADASKTDEAAPAQAQPPAQGQGGDTSKDQSKGQGGSTTTEMLALAGGPTSPPAGGGSETPPPAAPGPGAPGPGGGAPNMGPNAPGARGGGAPGSMVPGGSGGPNMGPNAPGNRNNADPGNMMAQQMKGQQQAMQAQRGAGPGGAAGGAPGGASNVAAGPADVSSPQGAVHTFLEALKARDADRLSEATARRAANESAEKNRDLFTKILEVTLSDSELDDLAKKLEGYQVAFENPAKSTGKVDVVIQKNSGNGARTTRKVTARREKKGWGVLDIGPSTEFSASGSGARRSGKSR